MRTHVFREYLDLWWIYCGLTWRSRTEMTLSEESRVVASWRSSPRKGQTLADNESVSVAEPELIGACLFFIWRRLRSGSNKAKNNCQNASNLAKFKQNCFFKSPHFYSGRKKFRSFFRKVYNFVHVNFRKKQLSLYQYKFFLPCCIVASHCRVAIVALSLNISQISRFVTLSLSRRMKQVVASSLVAKKQTICRVPSTAYTHNGTENVKKRY